MCQAIIYLKRNGDQEEIMREVISMERTEDGWIMQALLEEPRRVHGRIERIDFLKHTVTISEELI